MSLYHVEIHYISTCASSTKTGTFDNSNVHRTSSSRVRYRQKQYRENIKSMSISTLYSYPPTRFHKVANSTKQCTAELSRRVRNTTDELIFFSENLFLIRFQLILCTSGCSCNTTAYAGPSWRRCTTSQTSSGDVCTRYNAGVIVMCTNKIADSGVSEDVKQTEGQLTRPWMCRAAGITLLLPLWPGEPLSL